MSARYLETTLKRGTEMGFVKYLSLCDALGIDPLSTVERPSRASLFTEATLYDEEDVAELTKLVERMIRERRELFPPTFDQMLSVWAEYESKPSQLPEDVAQYLDFYLPPSDSGRLNPTKIGKKSLTSEVLRSVDVGHFQNQLDNNDKAISESAALNQNRAIEDGYHLTTRSLSAPLTDNRVLQIRYHQLMMRFYNSDSEIIIAVFPKYIGPDTDVK